MPQVDRQSVSGSGAVTMRLYFPFYVQAAAAAEALRRRGCRVRYGGGGEREVLVYGPRRTVLGGMLDFQGSPVPARDPTAFKAPPATPPDVQQTGVNRPRAGQEPVFMPPMRLPGQTTDRQPGQEEAMAQKSTTDRGDVSMQDFRVSFASDRRARHFGSELLRKVRGARVSFSRDGRTVRVRHRPASASAVFGLASRAARSPFMRTRGRDGQRSGDQVAVPASHDVAMGPNDNVRYDWSIQFDQPTKLAAELAKLQAKGVDVSKPSGRRIIIHNRTLNEVHALEVQHGYSPKWVGPPTSSRTFPGNPNFVPGGAPSRSGEPPRVTGYKRLPGKAGQVFLRYAIHFASVAIAAVAAQEMRKRGIDSAELDPDGTLVVGLRDVLQRVLTSVANKYGGRVESATRTDTPPAPKPPVVAPREDSKRVVVGKPLVPPRPPPTPEHLRTKKARGREAYRLRRQASFAMGVDTVGLAWAVMDALSDEASRALIDALVAQGIRAVRHGGRRVVAQVRGSKKLAEAREVARRLGARFRVKRAGEKDDAAMTGILPTLGGLLVGAVGAKKRIGGRDEHGRVLNSDGTVRDTYQNRQITRDLQGRFASMGIGGAVTRATIAVARPAIEGVVEAARQVGARVLSAKREVTVGGVLKAVLIVEGTRQAVKDVRRAVADDERGAAMSHSVGQTVRFRSTTPGYHGKLLRGKIIRGPEREHGETWYVVEVPSVKDEHGVTTHGTWSRHDVLEDDIESGASMALPALLAGVTWAAALRFAGARLAEAVAFYLAQKGVEAVARGAEVHVSGLRGQDLAAVAKVAEASGGRVVRREREGGAASMGLRGKSWLDDSGAQLVAIAVGAAAIIAAQYLVTKGIQYVLRQGKLWVQRKDADKAEKALKETKSASLEARVPAVMAKYPWSRCVRDMRKRYGSEAAARRVCGKIRANRGAGMALTPLARKEHFGYAFKTDKEAMRFAAAARQLGAKNVFPSGVGSAFEVTGYVENEEELRELKELASKLRAHAFSHKSAAAMFERALPQAGPTVL